MIPGLDTATLLAAVGAIYLGLTVTMVMAWRQTPSMPGLGRFALAHGLTAVGAALVALRGSVPDLFTLVLGQAILVAGAVALFEGERAFFGLPARLRVTIPVAAATPCVLLYYVYVEPSARARILALSAVLAALSGWSASIAARRGRVLGDGPAALLRASSLAAVTAALALRFAIAWAGLRPGRDWSASALLLLVGIVGVQSVVAVLMIVGQRLVAAADRARRALAASEERYRGLFEQSLGLLCTHSLDGRILAVNAAAAAALGRSVDEMAGHGLVEFLAPAVRGKLAGYLETIAVQGEKSGTMVLLDRAGGERVWQYRNHLVREPDLPPYVVGHALDVTDRMMRLNVMSSAVERSLADWRMTFNTIPEPIIVADVEGRISRLNRAAARLCGLSFAEAAGVAVGALGAGEPWQALSLLVRQVAATREGSGSRRAVDPSSGREWDLSASASRASHDAAVRVVLIARDVSRQQELERSLRRSETLSAMGSIVAGVAHAVRNPLFGISAIMDAMSAEFRGRPELATYLSMLRDPVARLSDLMRELLDFGKPSALATTASGLAEVVERGIAAMRDIAAANRVLVRSASLEDLPPVLLDHSRMERAIESLLENAIQHAPPGSEVLVEGRSTAAGAAEIEVLDTGPGFPPDVIGQVFEPFFTRRQGGTGLGLAIVRRIVEEHGGSVMVGNRTAGGGWVRVALPANGLPASGASSS